MNYPHNFHIPVLGLGYTIDTPLKVARYGISSVLSIVEDELIEDMREYYCLQNDLEYTRITEKDPDHREKRITAYLDLLYDLVTDQFSKMKASAFEEGSDIEKYFELLPEESPTRKDYLAMKSMEEGSEKFALQQQLRQSMVCGDIDVNVMAKLDNVTYTESGERMPDEYCDAVAALRGFAKSKSPGSVVFSAGYNPRLYNFAEQHENFYPGANDHLTKKIIIKVSDYRSALIQGKLLAKKGLWVSEFRIESGLNCGGHAFPTEGILMGPILEEFRMNRVAMKEELFQLCNEALAAKGKAKFSHIPVQRITAQGGVGTAREHELLLNYFELDSVGWGSPFLLVPEVTNVDEGMLQLLATAQPGDYYLSNASPLGVPFHNFRKTTSEVQRKERIAKHKAGSPCYKKYLSSDTEFTEVPICTASRQYQHLKEKQLSATLSGPELDVQLQKLGEKECLCEGLTSSVRLKNDMKLTHKLSAVTICPGPNLKWFSGIFSLKEMVDHIYGKISLNNSLYRPHLFVNELKLYVDYLKNQISETASALNEKQVKYFQKFRTNLLKGIEYYKSFFLSFSDAAKTLEELCSFEKELLAIKL
ncbi:MAG: hypothetical protein ACM3VS_05370 [Candidatus Dadabacteria bacterium]